MARRMFYNATPGLFRKARALRAKPTRHEQMLWERLRDKKILLARIRRQHPIGNYIVDFYCHAARLVIEIDGPAHKLSRQIPYDIERTSILISHGLMVIRFSNEDVENSLDKVVEKIAECVKERTFL